MKRGQLSLGNAPTIVVLLGFTIMVAAAIAISLDGLKTSSSTTGAEALIDQNSIALPNGTNTYFADVDTKGVSFITCTNTYVFNGTNLENVTAQFTVDGCSALLSNSSYDGVTFTVNYTGSRTTYTHTYNMTEDGERGLNNLSLQIPTVGTVIGVALIIVVIVGAFMFLFKPGGGL